MRINNVVWETNTVPSNNRDVLVLYLYQNENLTDEQKSKMTLVDIGHYNGNWIIHNNIINNVLAWADFPLVDFTTSNDFYLQTNNVYNRLKEEYNKYGKLIIAVDFDDTIFDFHKKGRLYNDVINLLKQWQSYADIIIWSGHTEEQYSEIQNYCNQIGLTIQGINCDSNAGYFGRKIYANVYLDDRAGLSEMYMILTKLLQEIQR